MRQQDVPLSRWKLNEEADGLVLVIRVQPRLLLRCYWSIFVLGATVFLVRALLTGALPGLPLLLIATISVCAFLLLYAWLWSFFGAEKIKLTQDSLRICKGPLGLGFCRLFDLDRVRFLQRSRARDDTWGEKGSKLFALGTGDSCLAFQYGAHEYYFANNIDVVAAENILDAILSRFPQLSNQDDLAQRSF
jgi:hypothetical protein